MAPRETENNAYAKFWGGKQRVLWYVMVFSGVVNCFCDTNMADVSSRINALFKTQETCNRIRGSEKDCWKSIPNNPSLILK